MTDVYGDLVFIKDGNLFENGEELSLKIRKVNTINDLNLLEPIQVYGNVGIFAGGSGDGLNKSEWFNFSAKSDSYSFGELTRVTDAGMTGTSNGSNNKGIFSTGIDIDQISINHVGDSTEWGSLVTDLLYMSSHSNGPNDRALIAGGQNVNWTNVIQYKTISTNADAQDFGDLTREEKQFSSTSNGINNRGLFSGGWNDSYLGAVNQISYITISSLGDAQDFGDLTDKRDSFAMTSNGELNRAVMLGGRNEHGANLRLIQYVDISTTANAVNFGALIGKQRENEAVSNSKGSLGIISGGDNESGLKFIERFNLKVIPSNSVEFGSLEYEHRYHAGCSNGDAHTTMMTVPPLSNGELVTVLNPLSLYVIKLDFDVDDTERIYSKTFFEIDTHEHIFYELERGFFIGGITNAGITDKIDMVNIGTLSDATYFSDLSLERYDAASLSNSLLDIAVTGGGWNNSDLTSIEYFKMVSGSSVGTALSFGNLTDNRRGLGGVSNGFYDRGVFISGFPTLTVMDYITISTPADAVTFGNLLEDRGSPDCTSNLIGQRAVVAGGEPNYSSIEFFSISTLSDGMLFGYLDAYRFGMASCCNSIMNKAVFSGGQTGVYSVRTSIMEYFDVMTSTAAEDFGDLITHLRYAAGNSNGVGDRGIVAGGDFFTDLIQYFGIRTNTSVADFGDLAFSRHHLTSTSNSQ